MTKVNSPVSWLGHTDIFTPLSPSSPCLFSFFSYFCSSISALLSVSITHSMQHNNTAAAGQKCRVKRRQWTNEFFCTSTNVHANILHWCHRLKFTMFVVKELPYQLVYFCFLLLVFLYRSKEGAQLKSTLFQLGVENAHVHHRQLI